MNGRHSHNSVAARVAGGTAGAVAGVIVGFVAIVLAIAITRRSLGGLTVWHGAILGALVGSFIGVLRPMGAVETLLDLLRGVAS